MYSVCVTFVLFCTYIIHPFLFCKLRLTLSTFIYKKEYNDYDVIIEIYSLNCPLLIKQYGHYVTACNYCFGHNFFVELFHSNSVVTRTFFIPLWNCMLHDTLCHS